MALFEHILKIFKAAFILFLLFLGAHLVFASETSGTIDASYKYAWGENTGWINFGCDNCHVGVTDAGLSGYAWSKQYGWINLNPDTGGVKNDGEGNLSGLAWGRNLGWINFSGVVINSAGEFVGYATVRSDSSRINFNCATGNSCAAADFKVKTDWRPASFRQPPPPASGGGGNGGHPLLPPPATPPTTPPVSPPPSSNPIVGLFNSFFDFFSRNAKPSPPIAEIPKVAPLALDTRWNLLPVEAINSFVFSPLPYEIQVLAAKFPEFGTTLKTVGVERMTDLNRLINVTFNIPGLAEQLSNTLQNVGMEKLNTINNINGVSLNLPGLSNPTGQLGNELGVGKIALISGLPLAKFSVAEKRNLPSEFVFARADGELVDLNVALSINDTGQVSQKISSLPGQILKLVVKPISKARSVSGYFVFQSASPKVSENTIARESLTASALFSMNGLVEQTSTPVPVEQKLVLSSFEYTDPDHDGIYTADVASPTVPGEYEVVTVIDYVDPVLGVRKMSMIAVVDPEGYVYEKNGDKETRIPSAIVSLYYLNPATKNYELWPAKAYQQENPQVTDVRGTYSFLVPEGSYYFEVEAPGYQSYQGHAFVVAQGGGVHQNIELKSSGNWFYGFDWKTLLLVVVLLLLVYNLLKDRLSRIFKRV